MTSCSFGPVGLHRALPLLALLVACEEPRPEPPASPAEPVTEAMQDLLPPPPPSAWPDDVVGLRDAIEAFTDVDACLAALRARTPTEVAEGVNDLGYDAFFADVCASMEAVRAHSVEGCDALSISSARRGCRRRLALFHGDPGACPEDPVTPGREALCIAWASRDPDLCRAATPPDRPRCEAVLADDAERCERARGGDRVRCEAEVERYGGALAGDRRESPATADTALRVEVDGATLTRDVSRGVRLVPRGCRMEVVLAEGLGVAAVGREEPSFSLELSVPARLVLPARIPLSTSDALLTVTTPTRGTLSTAAGARGHVEITAWEERLGGAIAGTIDVQLSELGDRVPVRGRFATYVRDLDPLDPGCRAP